MKENKHKTRILSSYYKRARIPVKKKIWKRQMLVAPACSSVVYKDGWYDIYLTFEKYGEGCYKAVDDGDWIEIADAADKFFSRFLRRLI